MEIGGLFLLILVVVVVIRLHAGSLDTERIEEYVRGRGWKLIDRSWDPFGPGWFGEKSDRIYEIVFEDGEGDTHRAHVKTSLFTGVYLTNDRIVKCSDRRADLETENERLKRRIAELERRT